MWHEAGKFAEPFCGGAEPNYFRDLLNRVAARSAYGLVIEPKTLDIISEAGGKSAGFVVWKRRRFGEQTGLCISGESAGALVFNGPFPIRVERMLTIDGAWFDEIKAKSSIESSNLSDALKKKLLATVTEGGDGSLATALVMLLIELGYPVDSDKFIENIRRTALRSIDIDVE